MAHARGAVLARIAFGHPGQLLAVAGGVGYLLAYINVRCAAAGLGVAGADLGLTTNDYLVSAALWVFVFVPFIACYVWLQSLTTRVGWGTLTGVTTALGVVSTALVVVVSVGTSLSARWAFMTLVVIAVFAALGWWLGGPGLSAVLTISVALLCWGPPTAYLWGQEVREDPATPKTTPFWLKLVLSVEEGRAGLPAGAECVIRMSDRVYVTAATVRVEPAAVAFQTADCFDTP
jgi:hypothetical protein